MIVRFSWLFLAIVALVLAGCGSPDFGPDSVKGILEGAPVSFPGEQVTLTQSQVDCGVKEDLWDPPDNHVARLTQKGRDLKFSDDVRLNDPDVSTPYVQINGAFPVQVADGVKLRDGNKGTKLAEVKIGVVITDDCFTAPLPVMGVKKGKFSPDAPVVFQFKGAGKEWSLDKLVH